MPPAPPAPSPPAQLRRQAPGLPLPLVSALVPGSAPEAAWRRARTDVLPPTRAGAGLSRTRFIEVALQDFDRVESGAQEVRRLRSVPRTPPRRKATP